MDVGAGSYEGAFSNELTQTDNKFCVPLLCTLKDVYRVSFCMCELIQQPAVSREK